MFKEQFCHGIPPFDGYLPNDNETQRYLQLRIARLHATGPFCNGRYSALAFQGRQPLNGAKVRVMTPASSDIFHGSRILQGR
jgi:hypothetical protein